MSSVSTEDGALTLTGALKRAALQQEVDRLMPKALASEHHQRKYRAARKALREFIAEESTKP